MFPAELLNEATALIRAYEAAGHRLATAESCTGGLVAALLTEVPGSSNVLEAGYVTYSNAAKTDLLGVPKALIATHGAVSADVARSMAEGALKRSGTEAAVAITGIAGPGGATPGKPVGLVHFAVARTGLPTVHHEARFGDVGRSSVRIQAVRTALHLLRAGIAATGDDPT